MKRKTAQNNEHWLPPNLPFLPLQFIVFQQNDMLLVRQRKSSDFYQLALLDSK